MTKMKFSGNSKTENVVKLCLKFIIYHFSSPDGIPDHFGSCENFQAGSYGKLKRLVKFFRWYVKKCENLKQKFGFGKNSKMFQILKNFQGDSLGPIDSKNAIKIEKLNRGVDWEDLFENQTITYRHVPSRTVRTSGNHVPWRRPD